VELGKKGGKARAEGLSAKRRKEIAKKAAKERGDNQVFRLQLSVFSLWCFR
jgi:hypothetical protein